MTTSPKEQRFSTEGNVLTMQCNRQLTGEDLFTPTIRAMFHSLRAEACQTRYNRNLRQRVLSSFDRKCAHCGFDDVRALQLDHVNGGGTKEQKRIGLNAIYRRALTLKGSYQLLCANCNWIKRFENNEHRKL